MSVELLDRIRKINKLLHNNTSNVFVFNDICHALSDAMTSNVIVMSRKGKILGMGNTDPDLIDDSWKAASVGVFIDPSLNERLLKPVINTQERLCLPSVHTAGRRWQYLCLHLASKLHQSFGGILPAIENSILQYLQV